MSKATPRLVVTATLLAGILLCACGKKDDANAAASASASASAAPPASATDTSAASNTPPPVPKPTPVVQGGNIDGCCTALNVMKTTGKDAAAKRKAEAAAAVCPGIAKLVKDGKTSRKDGLTQIKSALTGASVPSACE